MHRRTSRNMSNRIRLCELDQNRPAREPCRGLRSIHVEKLQFSETLIRFPAVLAGRLAETFGPVGGLREVTAIDLATRLGGQSRLLALPRLHGGL